jgi:NhaP-type Na+/H+ or K+/H+ antiporter
MPWNVVLWFVAVGLVLVSMGTAGPALRKAWLSNPIIYLLAGVVIGPLALGLLEVNLIDDWKFMEHLTEVAVVVSLFAAGLKMRMPLRDSAWRAPVLLATLTMTVTVGLITLLGWWALSLPLGLAVLLGAVMAPTDPVLADDVQVKTPDDKDRLRLMLTGEAGLNDGTAFPFVLLGVGLAGAAAGVDLHGLGAFGWKWLVVDVIYKVAGGLLLGWFGGCLLARFAIWCRRRYHDEIGTDALLSLGLIALLYGAALAIDTYAFLAVFAGAVAFRRIELDVNADKTEAQAMDEAKQADVEQEAESPQHAPAILMRDQMEVADTLEKLVQVTLVVPVGAMLSMRLLGSPTPWLAALVAIFVVRPLAVYLTAWRCDIRWEQRAMTAWLGIRGIGTLYYLTHGFGLGVVKEFPDQSRLLADVCLATITLSVIIHGISVTPLMSWYKNRCETRRHIEREEREPGELMGGAVGVR